MMQKSNYYTFDVTFTLCACVYYLCLNGFPLNQGEPLQESLTRKTHSATAIQWHPKKMILAMGWETGEITIRNEQDGETHNGPMIHEAEITILHWTSLGSKLLTGDSVSLGYIINNLYTVHN